MIHKLAVVVFWLSADPNRARLILVTATLALLLAGAFIPGLVALADGGTGGSHIP